jgi:uncharacterized protein YxeA
VVEIITTILIMVFPLSIGISIIIATIYYNKNYYLKTKIEYLKEKRKHKNVKLRG